MIYSCVLRYFCGGSPHWLLILPLFVSGCLKIGRIESGPVKTATSVSRSQFLVLIFVRF